MTELFKAEIEQANSATAVMNLLGDMTTLSREAVNQAYVDASEQGAQAIIFNFREGDYINTAGVAILFSLVTEAQKRQQQLLIAMPVPHFQKIFQMMGLTHYIEMHTNLDDALQAATNEV